MQLSELNWKNIAQWPKSYLLTAMILSNVILFSVGYFFIINPQLNAFFQQRATQISLIHQQKMQQQDKKRALELQQQLQQLNQQLSESVSQKNSESILTAVIDDAAANGLEILELHPEKIKPQVGFHRITIALTTSGSYQQLTKFVHAILCSELLQINVLSLTSNPNKFNLALRLTAYWLPETTLSVIAQQSANPLTQFSIKTFQLTGIGSEQQHSWAFIKAGNGDTYICKPGDIVGTEQGLIVRISNNTVLIQLPKSAAHKQLGFYTLDLDEK